MDADNDATSGYWQLILEVPGNVAEALEAALEATGAAAITLTDAADDPVLEPAPGTTPLWRTTRVLALYDNTMSPAAVTDELARLYGPLPPWEAQPVPERDWPRAWLDAFQPMRFGARLWITPSWHEPPRDGVSVVLDPGLAFGTGTHPTTALCLTWLDELPLTGETVLDYGCGSGILAIAALKLGAHHVVAVDHDPQALSATRENANRNRVADRITLLRPDGLADSAQFGIVVANILAGPLIALAPRLIQLVAPGGRIALAGLLDAQAAEVAGPYRTAIAFEAPRSRDGWTLLSGRRKPT